MKDSVNIIIPAIRLDNEVLKCLKEINKIKYRSFFVTLVLDYAYKKKNTKI